ncbi:MAG: TetR/AcrR family transcriptional regulator [Acidimicrobiales bacterium]
MNKKLVPEVGQPLDPPEPSPEAGRWSLTVASRTTRAHGRRTIAKLLDAAVSEFASYGYHGASMARIAKRAGTAHGTVYLHFADKDDLLSAAMTDVSRDIEPALGAVPPFEPGDEGLAILNDWLEVVCQKFQAHGAMLQALSEALQAGDHSRVSTDSLRRLAHNTALIADRVRATGASDIDPQIAALAIYALIEGANRSMYRGQLLVSTDELAIGLAEFIQRSLFGGDSPKLRARA